MSRSPVWNRTDLEGVVTRIRDAYAAGRDPEQADEDYAAAAYAAMKRARSPLVAIDGIVNALSAVTSRVDAAPTAEIRELYTKIVSAFKAGKAWQTLAASLRNDAKKRGAEEVAEDGDKQ